MSRNIISAATDYEIGFAVGRLSLRGEPFSTIDVIRLITGSYLCDTNTPPAVSANAQFGKRLSENSSAFRIERVLPDVTGVDDVGNGTTTAMWRSTWK